MFWKWSILHWSGCDSLIVQRCGILSYELVQVIQGVPLVEKGGDASQHKSCRHTVPDVDTIMVLLWEVVIWVLIWNHPKEINEESCTIKIKFPALICIFQSFLGDDRLKRFNHKWTSTIATAFIAMHEVWNAVAGVQTISIYAMVRVHVSVEIPKTGKDSLPLRHIAQVVTCKQHAWRLIQQGPDPRSHAEEGPIDLAGPITRFPENDSNQPTSNFHWVQDVLVDQPVQVSTSIVRALSSTRDLPQQVSFVSWPRWFWPRDATITSRNIGYSQIWWAMNFKTITCFTEHPFLRTLQIMAASLLALFADSASLFATCMHMGHIGQVGVMYLLIYKHLGLPSKS